MAKRNYSPEYNKWRKEVLKRDRHKCQMPSCRSGKRLQVHHILRYADSYYTRFLTKNGITLCRACHAKIKDKEHFFVELFRTIVEKNEQR